MATDDDITYWLGRLNQGDRDAAQVIWDQYFQRLAHFARQKLNRMPRRAADEEDAALSALDSFCRGAAEGRFPQLKDRGDLWRLLVTITARKVRAQLRERSAKKRGQGKIRGESVFHKPDEEEVFGIEQVLGREASPETANMMVEQCERLINLLDNDDLRQVALLKLEGFTVEEIAEKLDCVSRTVNRKLKAIRACWSSEIGL